MYYEIKCVRHVQSVGEDLLIHFYSNWNMQPWRWVWEQLNFQGRYELMIAVKYVSSGASHRLLGSYIPFVHRPSSLPVDGSTGKIFFGFCIFTICTREGSLGPWCVPFESIEHWLFETFHENCRFLIGVVTVGNVILIVSSYYYCFYSRRWQISFRLGRNISTIGNGL